MSQAESSAIRSEIERSYESPDGSSVRLSALAAFSSDDVGFFYLIQLKPEHDSGSFKVGFMTDPHGRLQKRHCSTPYAHYVASWSCRRVWERAAIDCITTGCGA